MADGEKLGKLRKKLQEVTELIENADQKKTDCKHADVEANARLEKLEVELQSAGRRIVLIKKDLADTTERLQVDEVKLGRSTETGEEVEKDRDQLETKESEDEEKIETLEEQIKEMKRAREINELKMVESERKTKVCEADIANLRKKAEASEARVAYLEETIEAHGKKLEELEESEGASGEREALNEEKVNFVCFNLFKNSEYQIFYIVSISNCFLRSSSASLVCYSNYCCTNEANNSCCSRPRTLTTNAGSSLKSIRCKISGTD